MLSNLETDQEKLLQIILVGQPELLDKIRTPGMAQLDQRVSIRCPLTDLDEQETDRYIHHRLNVAGARGQVRFAPKAVAEIFHASHGVPRLINLVTDRALLAAYTEQSRDIKPAHVRKAVHALRGEEPEIARAAERPTTVKARGAPAWRVAALAVLLLVLAGAGAASYWPRETAEQKAEALYWRGAMPRSSDDGERAFRELVEKFPHVTSSSGRAAWTCAVPGRSRRSCWRAPDLSASHRQVSERLRSRSRLCPVGDRSARFRRYRFSVPIVAATDSLAVADRFLVSKMEQIAAICPPPEPLRQTPFTRPARRESSGESDQRCAEDRSACAIG